MTYTYALDMFHIHVDIEITIQLLFQMFYFVVKALNSMFTMSGIFYESVFRFALLEAKSNCSEFCYIEKAPRYFLKDYFIINCIII